jgi:hypothetical protein
MRAKLSGARVLRFHSDLIRRAAPPATVSVRARHLVRLSLNRHNARLQAGRPHESQPRPRLKADVGRPLTSSWSPSFGGVKGLQCVECITPCVFDVPLEELQDDRLGREVGNRKFICSSGFTSSSTLRFIDGIGMASLSGLSQPDQSGRSPRDPPTDRACSTALVSGKRLRRCRSDAKLNCDKSHGRT